MFCFLSLSILVLQSLGVTAEIRRRSFRYFYGPRFYYTVSPPYITFTFN